VYSLDRRKGQNEPIFSALDTLFQSLSEPKDFVLKINDPEIGYYYTKKLSPMPAEKLCDAEFLTEHFRKPLISVMDWYGKHSKQILALEPRRFKRV